MVSASIFPCYESTTLQSLYVSRSGAERNERSKNAAVSKSRMMIRKEGHDLSKVTPYLLKPSVMEDEVEQV